MSGGFGGGALTTCCGAGGGGYIGGSVPQCGKSAAINIAAVSFNRGDNPVNVAGVNAADGFVEIVVIKITAI